MSILSSAQVTTGQVRRRGAAGSGPLTRLNSIAGWSVFALVALAPIPFGSNRPFFWALWAAAAGGIGLWFMLAAKMADEELRVPVGEIRWPAAGFSVVFLVMLAQILPLGSLLPITFSTPFGETVRMATLSAAPGETLFALLRWGTYGVVFFVMLQAGVQEKRSRMMLRGLVLVAVAEGAYALVALTQLGDTILFFDKRYYQGAATGTFVNRNSLATFLGLGIVAAAALATRRARSAGERGRKGRELPKVDRVRLLLLGAAMFLLFAALLATQSRMGLLATLAGVAAVVLLRPVGNRAVTAGLVIAGAVAVAFFYGSGVAERALTTEASLQYRLALYRQVVDMIVDRPLLGHGAGAFALTFPPFHTPALDMSVTWDHAHSTYLALWSGLGVVVGTIPMVIVAAICLVIVRRSFSRGGASVESAAALGATVTVALHSVVDFSLEIQAVALFYTALLAIGAARPFSATARGGG